MSNQLQIQQVRHVLIRLEETIIFALIERSQFLRNAAVYEAGRFAPPLEGQSLCGFMLQECERSHAKVRRYTSPDEHPFFTNLPEPILPAIGYGNNPLYPNSININDRIRARYESEILDRITQPGDDEQYGSTAVCDVACLQALSKRIHYGKFVAESKCLAATKELQHATQSRDPDAVWHAITDAAVEDKVLDRVHHKACTYTNELKQATSQWSLQPDVIRDIYKDFIIPLNKEVQVAYILTRQEQEPDAQQPSGI
jgi:chorismate mutase